MAWHLSSDRARKNNQWCDDFWWENAQLCGKQTGLCGQISAVDKIDKKRLQKDVQKNSETKSLSTHNLSSSVECTSFSPTLIVAFPQGLYRSLKIGKVMEFYWRSWKVMEKQCAFKKYKGEKIRKLKTNRRESETGLNFSRSKDKHVFYAS